MHSLYLARLAAFIFVATVPVSLLGCDSTADSGETCATDGIGACYFYQARDLNGILGVQGYMRLQVDGDGQVQGVWRLERVDPQAQMGAQVGVGVLVGTLSGSDFIASLNPEGPTSGVELTGTFGEGTIVGTWLWNAADGSFAEGLFEAQRIEGR